MPVLFISRGTMSGVCQLVECLQQRTGLRCASHESLTTIVNRYGELATRVVEGLADAISGYEQFSRLRWPYLVLMRHALLEEILEDNMIYQGYSGHFLLPPLQHFIRVRIDAPLELRIKMTIERLKCDEKAARDYITKADEERVRWGRFMFGRDLRDPKYYDLHLNLGHMSLNAMCGIFELVIAEEEFQMLPQTRMQVERLLLATSVEAALVTDPRTRDFEIAAKVEDGGLGLSGPYLKGAEVKAVMEVACAVRGVEKVRYSPGYAPTLDIQR